MCLPASRIILIYCTDIVLHGPYTRKVRVLSIGAGVTGIMNAYLIQKRLENVEHVIYEKNADIGGTWLENRYPGELEDQNVPEKLAGRDKLARSASSIV
jgi:hypothetical protein